VAAQINGEMMRRRLMPAEKEIVLAEAFGPGGSVAAAADRFGVSTAAIYLWRRHSGEHGAHHPVQRLSSADVTRAPPAFVPVRVTALTDGPARIEIALGNGRVVKADASVAPATLAAIVDALDGRAT
jgi:transposase-like protein